MKRQHFFILAAIIPGLFGLVMMVVPHVMLGNSLVVEADANTRVVTQWVGFGVFSLVPHLHEDWGRSWYPGSGSEEAGPG
jgi:hypothetical protein